MSCGDLDSVASARNAERDDCLRLNETVLAQPELSAFQRSVLAGVLSVLRTLPPDSTLATAEFIRRIPPARPELKVVLRARKQGCADVTLFVEHDKYVRIAAGADTSYSLPEDVWDPQASDVPTFTAQIVHAITQGALRETTYYRGDVPVRWVSELQVGKIPIRISRAAPLKLIRHLWKARTKSVRSYGGY